MPSKPRATPKTAPDAGAKAAANAARVAKGNVVLAPPATPLTDDERKMLVKAGQDARAQAYAPYSHYAVGAAVLTADGTIFDGCNVENASYGATICAERTAVVKAVSQGARLLRAVVVVTENGGAPCGVCRQVLYEFGPRMTVLLANAEGHVLHEFTLDALMPEGFGPLSLDHQGQGVDQKRAKQKP